MNLKNMKCHVPSFFKSIKYTLAGVNGVFLLTGILLIIVGVVVLIRYKEYEGLITKGFFTMPGFVIATGALIFLTSILGFYGAISEQFYFIAGYVMLLIVVLVFEISMIIVAFGLRSNPASAIQSTMKESLNQYNSKWDITQLWDELQMDFECCGVGGRFDWVSNQIPISCCHIDYGIVGEFSCGTANAYPTGCAQLLGEWLGYNAFIVAVSAAVVTCLQVPITALAAWMAWRSKYHQVELES